MADVLNFKCPCCGAALSFNSDAGEMVCAYCDSHFTMEQVKAAQESEEAANGKSDMVWDTHDQEMVSDEDGKLEGYQCPSCGAQMVAGDNTAATECPYCGNPAIIPQSFSGMYKPDHVIPFKVNKEQAKEALKNFTKGKKLLPSSFLANNRIEDITGLYVPFWLYSCHASGSVFFEGVKSKRWSDANYDYVKKDHYFLDRSGSMDFEKIPVDAATRMDDAMMDSLEPYDMKAAVAYDAAYFSGYLADRYDVEEADARPRANERVINTFRNQMRSEVGDYEEVSEKSENIKLSNAKAEYAMLPVWMMTTKYQDKAYTFGINGQTGRMVGELPIDKSKYWKYVCLSALIALVIGSAIAFFAAGKVFNYKAEAAVAVISLLIGFIYGGALKGAMKNVAKQTTAKAYMKEGSYKRGRFNDRLLYSKTDKKERPRQNA